MKKFMLFLILVTGIIGVYFWMQKGQIEAKDEQEDPTVTVSRGSISLTVSTTGRVVANFDVEIKCKASGQVTKLPYDVSDLVKTGELLVELDPTDEQRVVEQAKVSLSASQARLTQAKQNFLVAEKKWQVEQKRAKSSLESAEAKNQEAQAKIARVQKLMKTNLTSQQEYDAAVVASIQAKSELENARIRFEELKVEKLNLESIRQEIVLAETQVESNQVNLSVAQQRLADTKVFAPLDAVVTTRNVQIGQIISSGISNVGGGTAVMTLSDLSRMFVIASVDESDIGKVQVEQPAMVTADAFPGKFFPGKVVRIATRGVNTSNVVTFEVKIELVGRNKHLLKPEMTTNIDIIAADKDGVLLVPVEAVYKKHRPRKKGVADKSEKRANDERANGGKRNKSEQQANGEREDKKRVDDGKENSQEDFLRRRRPQHFVRVAKADGSVEEREVEVGISDGTQMEIISGLQESELVIVPKDREQSRWRRGNSTMRAGRMMLGGRRRGQ